MACLQALGALRSHGSNNTATVAVNTAAVSTTATLTSSLTSPLRGSKKVPRVIHAVQFLVQFDPHLRHSAATASTTAAKQSSDAAVVAATQQCAGLQEGVAWQYDMQHNTLLIAASSTSNAGATSSTSTNITTTAGSSKTATTAATAGTTAAAAVAAVAVVQPEQALQVRDVMAVELLTCLKPASQPLFDHLLAYQAKQRNKQKAASAAIAAAAQPAAEAATRAAAAEKAATRAAAAPKIGTATTAVVAAPASPAAAKQQSPVANKGSTTDVVLQQRELAITVAEIEAADIALAAVAAVYGTTVEDAVQTLDPELDLENGELLLDVLAAAIHTVALASSSTVQLAHVRQQLHDAVRPPATAKTATAATAASHEAEQRRLQQEHAASVIGRAARAKQSRDAVTTKRTSATSTVAAPAVVAAAATAATPVTAAAQEAEQYTRQQEHAAGVIGRAVRGKQTRDAVATKREGAAAAAVPAAVVACTATSVEPTSPAASTKTAAVPTATPITAVAATAAAPIAVHEVHSRQQEEQAASVIGRAARAKQARDAANDKRAAGTTSTAAAVVPVAAPATVTAVLTTTISSPAAVTALEAAAVEAEPYTPEQEYAAGVIGRAIRGKQARDAVPVKHQEVTAVAAPAAVVASTATAVKPTSPQLSVPLSTASTKAAVAPVVAAAVPARSPVAATAAATLPVAAPAVHAAEYSRQQEEQAAGVIGRAARAKQARDVVAAKQQEQVAVAAVPAAAAAAISAAPAAAAAAAVVPVAATARRPSSYAEAARGKPATAAVPATATATATTAGASPVIQAAPRTAVCEAAVHTTATNSSSSSSTGIPCTVQWGTPPAQSGTLYTITGSTVLPQPPADLDDDAAQARLERTLQSSYGLSVEQAVAVLGELPGVDLSSTDSVIAGLGTAVHSLRPACAAAAASAAVERALRGPAEWETLEVCVTGSTASSTTASTSARSVRVIGVRDAPAAAAVVTVDCSKVQSGELAAVLRSSGVPDSAAKVVLTLSNLIDIAAVLQRAASTAASSVADAAQAFMLPVGASTVTTASSVQYRVTTAADAVTVTALTAAGDDVLTVKVTLPQGGASHPLNKSTTNSDGSALLANNASVVSLHAGGVSGVILPVTTSSSTGDSSDTLTVGTAVEARFDGRAKWFGGTIAAVNAADSTYTVHYDDGDSEEHVLRLRIRLPGQKQPRALAVGSVVDARRGKVSSCSQCNLKSSA
jgi:trimeric autotransporter adhesin